MTDTIKATLQRSIDLKQQMLADEALLARIAQTITALTHCFQQGGKLLLCGNGGSAADAQHLAAEFSGRFYLNRAPLFAEALHVNTSYLTAVANDYGYDHTYSRLVEAMGRPGDMLWAFSTSGNSPNILAALEQARLQGMTLVGFTGATGGKMAAHCHWLLNMPSTDTPRIQEGHITVGHIICEQVERALFGEL
jgi:D-sedoheptulose 7-phosphate isomerase